MVQRQTQTQALLRTRVESSLPKHPSPCSGASLACQLSQEALCHRDSPGRGGGKRQLCVLGDTGGAVGAPTHVEGHSMGPTKLCLTEAASVSAAEVLMWALISAGAFLLLCTKIKDNWKIVKKNETRKKKNLSWPLVAVRDKFWQWFWSQRQKEMGGTISIFRRTYSSCS